MANYKDVQEEYYHITGLASSYIYPYAIFVMSALRDLLAAGETDEFYVECSIAGRVEDRLAENPWEEEHVRDARTRDANELMKMYRGLSIYPVESVLALIDEDMKLLMEQKESAEKLIDMKAKMRAVLKNLPLETRLILGMLDDMRILNGASIFGDFGSDFLCDDELCDPDAIAEGIKELEDDPNIRVLGRAWRLACQFAEANGQL